ncbi:hypothetical protein EV189_2930 [Motilibacter rhizosphaerae]|uniref:VCBS repeat-containing protein n=1 Tax=Motilibacter rhizosphaerae TaxID=598652 RepID=A0A4Q7NQC8_9ACTN|nr:Ig-like domain-containing protein [Motilibacter rhizosphaerae]RZS87499.1 hypothetical protein EV189_2930 [Motilibacter rhizosphaerae]
MPPSTPGRLRRTAGLAAIGCLLATAALGVDAGTAAAQTAPWQAGDLLVPTFGGFFDGGSGIDAISPGTGDRRRAHTLWINAAATREAVTPSGDLYVGLLYGDVYLVDHVTGQRKRVLVAEGASDGVSAITSDAQGRLLAVVNNRYGDAVLVRQTPDGAEETLLQHSWLDYASDLAVDSQGGILGTTAGLLWRLAPGASAPDVVANLADTRFESIALAKDGTILARTAKQSTGERQLVAVRPDNGGVTVLMTGGEMQESQGLAVEADGRLVSSERSEVSEGPLVIVRLDLVHHTQQDVLPGLGWTEANDIAVAGVPTIPVRATATPDAYKTTNVGPKAEPAAYGVLANDRDPAGRPLTGARLVAGPQHGQLTFRPDGSFSYVAAAGFVGTDTFTYQASDLYGVPTPPATVSMTVVASRIPTAGADAYATGQGRTLSIAAPGVLANDKDAQGDVLTAYPASQPAHGHLTLGSDGGFTYTPDPGFHGRDSFTYRALHSIWASDPATVTLQVEAPTTIAVHGGSLGADGHSATVGLRLADADTDLGTLSLSATSDDGDLLPSSAITFGGQQSDRTMSLRTVAGRTGTATITVWVRSGTAVVASLSVRVQVDGNGAGTLNGTELPDVLFGQGGNDTLRGAGGDDLVSGGAGDDTLTGGTGADVFRGGAGTNKVTDFSSAEGDTKTEA